MKIRTRLRLLIAGLLASLPLTSCGNGSSQSTPPPVSYSIGGTVTNLFGSVGGLQLQDNGGDTLSVNGNGTFTFATKLASGTAYSVTISAQPSAPAQTCGVTNGSGTATANVTNIVVDCAHNEWTWVGGANIAAQLGQYGTLGTSNPANMPGARGDSVTWTDSAGDFWLFGGWGWDSRGAWGAGALNDLWKYSGGEWTWMGGSNLSSQRGVWGTKGTPAPNNVPGSRTLAKGWIDANGDFWLFGGGGYDSTQSYTFVYMNDLWRYSGGQWTWMSGSNVGWQTGTYGTLGAPAPDNVPGSRGMTATWTDAAGNFWLFGGFGYDSAGTFADLNDLWKYSAGQWTWMSGSDVANQPGTYGTQGTPAPNNVPGARWGAITWNDSSGNFWLFGGLGYDSAGTYADLNDLWKYSGGQWIWMSGSDVASQQGTYGTLGTAAPGNVPGAREFALAWTDAAGNFWLFGGLGYDSAGTYGYLNDLWKYSGGQWTWISGSNLFGNLGAWGTPGTAAPGNVPSPRVSSVGWIDPTGNLWLFGGAGNDSTGLCCYYLNDLWKYEP